jgi:hypothetical protein
LGSFIYGYLVQVYDWWGQPFNSTRAHPCLFNFNTLVLAIECFPFLGSIAFRFAC